MPLPWTLENGDLNTICEPSTEGGPAQSQDQRERERGRSRRDAAHSQWKAPRSRSTLIWCRMTVSAFPSRRHVEGPTNASSAPMQCCTLPLIRGGSPKLPKTRTQEAKETATEMGEGGAIHPRSKAESPPPMKARHHSVARWSTFEEMDISSYALATKKGLNRRWHRAPKRISLPRC